MRTLLIELSGEHPTLPRSEALAVLETFGRAEPVGDDVGILVARSDVPASTFAGRTGLSHRVLDHWATVEPRGEAILDALAKRDLGGRRFAVRVRRIQGLQPEIPVTELERAAGAPLERTGRVDLTHPEVEARIFLARKAHVGATLASIDRGAFESRKLQYRAYHNPVTMHPRLARALVNLARIPPGGTLADFFCGTGGSLIEGALTGLRVSGSDAHGHMVDGATRTLAALRLKPDRLLACDVEEAPTKLGPADGVVADPPYGKASLVKGAAGAARPAGTAGTAGSGRARLDDLYAQAFASAAKMLAAGHRFVTVFPEERHVHAFPADAFVLEETHAIRVHRSLTRHVAVYVRRPRAGAHL